MNDDFCSSIEKSDSVKVADTFFTLKDCKKKLSVRTPDVLLLGLDLTDGYWIDFCGEIRKKYPGLKILVITTYDEYSVFKNSLNNPALTSGYISRDALPKVIVTAIHAIMEGKFFRYDKIVVPVEMEESNPEQLLDIIRQSAKRIKVNGHHRETMEQLTQMMDAAEKYRRRMMQHLLKEEKETADMEDVDKYLRLLIENLLVRGYPNWNIADMLEINIETVRLYRMDFILRLGGQNTMVVNRKDGRAPILLARREQQLLRLIAAGYTNEEIASDILYVDVETVRSTRNRCFAQTLKQKMLA